MTESPEWSRGSDRRLDRRSVLRLGLGAAALAVGGCSSGSPSRSSGPSTTGPSSSSSPSSSVIPPTTAGASPPTSGDWSALGSNLQGHLVLPTSSSYLTDLQIYDSRFDSVRPQGIAYCASASDVQRCVGFARDHDLPFAARAGGHSYGGYSTSNGLVIDVTTMSGVSLGASPGGTATVGAGARLIDVYSTLNQAGVSIPAGSCPTVGVAGLTLGGGVGVVDRAYGLTCDAVTSVTVVTADGQVVTADASDNSDLFWACRGGGGGNFGIATSFVYSTFQTSPLTLAFLTWPWSAAPDVLPAWLHWAPSAPSELWSNCLLEASPGSSSPLLQIGICWIGSSSGLTAPLSSLITAVGAPPATNSVETVPFAHAMYVEGGCASLSQAQCHLDTQPGGTLTRQPSLAKSGYVSTPLSDAGVQAITSGITQRQSEGQQGAVGFDAFGGAIGRVAPSATAFVHRSALASAQLNVPFTPSTPASSLSSSQAWLDSWYSSISPYLDGQAYQNYIDPGLADWAQAYYGSNLSRLSQIKQKWDPDDAFHFAQSIPA